jgi:hypothetical protein
MTDRGRSGIATIEEHHQKTGHSSGNAFISHWGHSLIARPPKESASQYTESARVVQGSVE